MSTDPDQTDSFTRAQTANLFEDTEHTIPLSSGESNQVISVSSTSPVSSIIDVPSQSDSSSQSLNSNNLSLSRKSNFSMSDSSEGSRVGNPNNSSYIPSSLTESDSPGFLTGHTLAGIQGTHQLPLREGANNPVQYQLAANEQQFQSLQQLPQDEEDSQDYVPFSTTPIPQNLQETSSRMDVVRNLTPNSVSERLHQSDNIDLSGSTSRSIRDRQGQLVPVDTSVVHQFNNDVYHCLTPMSGLNQVIDNSQSVSFPSSSTGVRHPMGMSNYLSSVSPISVQTTAQNPLQSSVIDQLESPTSENPLQPVGLESIIKSNQVADETNLDFLDETPANTTQPQIPSQNPLQPASLESIIQSNQVADETNLDFLDETTSQNPLRSPIQQTQQTQQTQTTPQNPAANPLEQSSTMNPLPQPVVQPQVSPIQHEPPIKKVPYTLKIPSLSELIDTDWFYNTIPKLTVQRNKLPNQVYTRPIKNPFGMVQPTRDIKDTWRVAGKSLLSHTGCADKVKDVFGVLDDQLAEQLCLLLKFSQFLHDHRINGKKIKSALYKDINTDSMVLVHYFTQLIYDTLPRLMIIKSISIERGDMFALKQMFFNGLFLPISLSSQGLTADDLIARYHAIGDILTVILIQISEYFRLLWTLIYNCSPFAAFCSFQFQPEEIGVVNYLLDRQWENVIFGMNSDLMDWEQQKQTFRMTFDLIQTIRFNVQEAINRTTFIEPQELFLLKFYNFDPILLLGILLKYVQSSTPHLVSSTLFSRWTSLEEKSYTKLSSLPLPLEPNTELNDFQQNFPIVLDPSVRLKKRMVIVQNISTWYVKLSSLLPYLFETNATIHLPLSPMILNQIGEYHIILLYCIFVTQFGTRVDQKLKDLFKEFSVAGVINTFMSVGNTLQSVQYNIPRDINGEGQAAVTFIDSTLSTLKPTYKVLGSFGANGFTPQTDRY